MTKAFSIKTAASQKYQSCFTDLLNVRMFVIMTEVSSGQIFKTLQNSMEIS